MATQAKNTMYNGMTNYETWAVSLWMNNDPNTQDYFRDMARGVSKTPNPCISELAYRLKQYHDDAAAQLMGDQPGVLADLTNAALSRVNWYEIAESLLDLVKE